MQDRQIEEKIYEAAESGDIGKLTAICGENIKKILADSTTKAEPIDEKAILHPKTIGDLVMDIAIGHMHYDLVLFLHKNLGIRFHQEHLMIALTGPAIQDDFDLPDDILKMMRLLLKNGININAELPFEKGKPTSAIYYLVMSKRFYAARFLLALGADPEHAKQAITKFQGSAKKRDLKKFSNRVKEQLSFPTLDKYQIYLLEEALRNGDAPEDLEFIKNTNPDIFRTFCLAERAAAQGKNDILEFLFDNKLIVSNWLDLKEYSLLAIAAQHGQLDTVKFLLNLKGIDAHKLAQSDLPLRYAYDAAVKNGHKEVAKFIDEQDIKLQKDAITLMSRASLTMNSFIEENKTGPKLLPKGVVLALEYYTNKQKDENPKLLYVRGFDIFQNTLHLFAKSKETNLSFLFDTATETERGAVQYYDDLEFHRLAIKLEKVENKIYLIIIDPAFKTKLSEDIFNRIISTLNLHCKTILPHLVVCRSVTNQQTASENCIYFSLKNLKKLAETNCIAKEILTLFTEGKITIAGVNVINFKLPPRFMSLAQSYDDIMNYIDKTKEAKAVVRVSKKGEAQDLNQYIFRKVTLFGVETPQAAPNRNYKSSDKESKTPKFILKNKSVEILRRKLSLVIVPTIFKSLKDPETMYAAILLSHDARYLEIDAASGRLVCRGKPLDRASKAKLASESSTMDVDAKKSTTRRPP